MKKFLLAFFVLALSTTSPIWLALAAYTPPIDEIVKLASEEKPEVKIKEPKIHPVFLDVEEHWARPYIENLYRQGIIKGFEDGSFHPDEIINREGVQTIASLAFNNENEEISNPDQAVTRAEAIKIIFEATELEISQGELENFTDVTPNDWFAPYSGFAKAIGLINGFEDGSFRGNENPTRAEVCKIISELIDYLEQ